MTEDPVQYTHREYPDPTDPRSDEDFFTDLTAQLVGPAELLPLHAFHSVSSPVLSLSSRSVCFASFRGSLLALSYARNFCFRYAMRYDSVAGLHRTTLQAARQDLAKDVTS